jgi:flagellin-like hook-associated protein FlgL
MAIALTAGMRNNLIALQGVDKLMQTTQNRLATGKKVNSALDDPVNFFKAQGHHDRASDLSALKDGMGESIKVIEAANTGIENIQALLNQMKSLASAAKTTEDPDGLETQYTQILTQINNLALDSGYGGQNLLAGDSISVVFNEDGLHTLDVDGTTADSTQLNTIAGVTVADAGDFTDSTAINTAIGQIDGAIKALRTEAQKLSSSLSTIQIRADFTNEMVNTLNTGGDNLVLADMNEEGANMLMLQTRQNLGTTSLSLASQAAQSVLRLF